ITCEHCGSVARRDSRSEPDAAPDATPDAAPDETLGSRMPQSYPRQPDYSWQLPMIGLLASIGLGFAVWSWTRAWHGSSRAQRSVAAASPAPAPSPPRPPKSPPPRLLPGIVLITSQSSDDEDLWVVVEDPASSGKHWLERVNGTTGRAQWKRSMSDTPELGTAPDTTRPDAIVLRAELDGGLLVAGPEKVSALDPKTGETLWTRDSGGSILDLCAGDGFAGLVFPKSRLAAFSMITGATLKDRSGSCEPAVTSRSVAPNFTLVDGAGIKPPLPPRPPFRGRVARVLVPHKGTARVALASDDRAAAVAVAGRQWVWSTRLGAGKSGVPRFLVPPLAAVRNERVVVPYVLEPSAELRLASLELASGQLVWDRLLTSESVPAEATNAELRVARRGAIYFSDGQGRLWATTPDAAAAWSWEP
ncbi:MAG TPA: PQQ-binding-like beta-propeller repeat protein, partial [Polyangiaceae bacterium]|nr:PQQ-binding-like beta-propeller repeat protein [Polyangiaceae bacterium]